MQIGEKTYNLLPKPKGASRFIQMVVSNGCFQQRNRRKLVAIDASAKQFYTIVIISPSKYWSLINFVFKKSREEAKVAM